ncbi:hypothetical protein C9374_009435 [Naegleria lovaniensis]|uniref:F-box domain-containing protein n=1 Tax=Naegleria lovaniensis TaxID=51637 RepID=A0AA88KP65_NAELO|nr:uncharacterized protein C9374_009435 [Naegleria lovaniensis]KAG2392858.1 hypothetical protein C9374_009435 [Naegleria lovaniensis]
MGNFGSAKLHQPPPHSAPLIGMSYDTANIPPQTSASKKIIHDLFPTDYPLVYSTSHDNEKLKVPDKEKVYNFKNLSILEEYLPDEIMINILKFLPMKCVLQLGRVSKNFYNYWIEFPQLWNNNSDLCTMLYLPQRYENNHRKNFLFFLNEFKPKIVNVFQNLSEKSKKGPPIVVKCMLIGPSRCGKSALVDRACQNIPFRDTYTKTIGTELRMKHLSNAKEDEQYTIQLWDMGEASFKNIITYHFREPKGYFYCFDLNDHSSFNNIMTMYEDWKTQNRVENLCEYLESEDSCLILLGLKSDLSHNVTREEIVIFLETITCSTEKTLHTCRVQYFELSSKTCSVQDLLFPFVYACTILPLSKPLGNKETLIPVAK